MNRDMLCRALSSFTEDDHQQEDKEGNMINRVIKAIRQNIVAWLALFVALSGTSMAASHYIITSTKQIKPSVLRQLRGARGPRGAPGAMGTAGAKGANGAQGPAGATGSTGSAGSKGEKGTTGMVGKEGLEGPQGPEGPEGHEGKEGLPGTALAYAHVNAEGTVIEAFEKGHAAPNIKVTQPVEEPTGIYCISGLGFDAHNVVGTIDYNETQENQSPVLTATLGAGEESECPEPDTQITVETSEKAGELKNEGFYIVIN
jgi:Collagen triple helix repeat (20 copies)